MMLFLVLYAYFIKIKKDNEVSIRLHVADKTQY